MQGEKYIGKVVWFDAKLGYGFISRTNDSDLFVHWSDVESEGFKTLKKGQEVSFSIGLTLIDVGLVKINTRSSCNVLNFYKIYLNQN